MITLEQFFMGRDTDPRYACEMTDELRNNAVETVRRVNLLLGRYEKSTGDNRPRGVNSGWRPSAINCVTPGAAKKSSHMICCAVDIADKSKTLKKWLMTEEGLKALEEIGLWIEDPEATPTWAHFQTKPPASGRRVFHP